MGIAQFSETVACDTSDAAERISTQKRNRAKSLRVPRMPGQSQNVEGDLTLRVARERLIGDQGEDQFGEGWHDDMIAVAVSAAPRSIAET